MRYEKETLRRVVHQEFIRWFIAGREENYAKIGEEILGALAEVPCGLAAAADEPGRLKTFQVMGGGINRESSMPFDPTLPAANGLVMAALRQVSK